MGDGSGGGWGAGKIALAIAGGCFVLMLLCCTGTYFSNRDKIDEAVAFLGETAEFGQQFVAGTRHFDGVDLLALSSSELRRQRRQFQMIFQDPYGSLNPRMRVGTALASA